METIKTFLLDRWGHLVAVVLAVLMLLGQYTPADMSVADVPVCDEDATRVISFNLRCKDDIYGTVGNRSTLVIAALKAYAPDSFGVQEATSKWIALLDAGLGDEYARVGDARNDLSSTEYNVVYYRTDKFNLLDSGTRWLSRTPETPASRSYFTAYPRICTWATLENKETGRVYTHLNTHLDHILEYTRARQAEVLVEQIKVLEETAPVVCTGDFNAQEGGRAYKVLAEAMDDTKQTAVVSDDGQTFHNYGRPLRSDWLPIDFIFVTHATPVQLYNIIDQTVGGMYLSDHYGLCSDIVI